MDILSDTQGVDFGPYLTKTIQNVRENWYRLIPESLEFRKGKLALEFAIMKDGHVQGLQITSTSGDPALDRPAYASITASNPFPPLPTEFNGPYLALRFRFYYNTTDLDASKSNAHTNDTVPVSAASTPSKSGVAVNISSSNSMVVAGESRVITVTVTGTKKHAVKWNISGLSCSHKACGEMIQNLYVAPHVPPVPNEITLTAISKADPTAKASVILHIVQRTSSQ